MLHNLEVAVIAKVKGTLVARKIAHNVNHAIICLVGTMSLSISCWDNWWVFKLKWRLKLIVNQFNQGNECQIFFCVVL